MKNISKKKFSLILSENKVNSSFKYGKARVSGSRNSTYFMHSKSAYMPGNKSIFSENSILKPKDNLTTLENSITRGFKEERHLESKPLIGRKYNYNYHQKYTYQEYNPYDDTALNFALKAAFRQVFGNFIPMESERPIDIERRLRNGDITIREFIRELAKSEFYKKHYYELVNQKECIKLLFKHLLGRPINSQSEFIQKVETMFHEGFEGLVDSIIDSIEYIESFGEDSIPYQRFWDSPLGASTSSFIKTATYEKGFATSDNVIYTDS